MSISPVSITTPNLVASYASTRPATSPANDSELASASSLVAQQLAISPPSTSVVPETTRPVEEVTPTQQQELATTTQDALRSRSEAAPEESSSATPASPSAIISPPVSADGGNQIQPSLSGVIAEVEASTAGAASEEASEDSAEILIEQQRTQARNNPYADLSAGQPAQATRGGSMLDLSV